MLLLGDLLGVGRWRVKHRFHLHCQVPAAQPVHRVVEIFNFLWNPECLVLLQRFQRTLKALGRQGEAEVESIQQHRHNVALVRNRGLILAAQPPVGRIGAALQRRGGQ